MENSSICQRNAGNELFDIEKDKCYNYNVILSAKGNGVRDESKRIYSSNV